MEYNQAPTQNTQHIFTQTRATCRELMALLVEENSGIAKHDVQLVESRLHHKKRLTLRLEQMLAEVKRSASLWKADANAQTQAQYLAEDIKHFQTLVKQNSSLLQAAHQLRADLIVAIRDEVDARAPKAHLYGSSGAITKVDGSTRLLAREV